MTHANILDYLATLGVRVEINQTDMTTHALSGIALDDAFIPSDGITDYRALAEFYGQPYQDREDLYSHLAKPEGYLATPVANAPADIYWGGIYMTDLEHWATKTEDGDYDFIRSIPFGDNFYHNVVMPHRALPDFKEYNDSLIWRYRECARTCFGYGHHIHAIACLYMGTIVHHGAEYFCKPPIALADRKADLPSFEGLLRPARNVRDRDLGHITQREYVEGCIEAGRLPVYGADHPFSMTHSRTNTVGRVLQLRTLTLPASFTQLWKLFCLSGSLALPICAFHRNVGAFQEEGYITATGQLADANEKTIVLRFIERANTIFQGRTGKLTILEFLRILADIVNHSYIPVSLRKNKPKLACLTIIHGGFRCCTRGFVYQYTPLSAEMSEHHIQSLALQHVRGWDCHQEEPEQQYLTFWERFDDGFSHDEDGDDEVDDVGAGGDANVEERDVPPYIPLGGPIQPPPAGPQLEVVS